MLDHLGDTEEAVRAPEAAAGTLRAERATHYEARALVALADIAGRTGPRRDDVPGRLERAARIHEAGGSPLAPALRERLRPYGQGGGAGPEERGRAVARASPPRRCRKQEGTGPRGCPAPPLMSPPRRADADRAHVLGERQGGPGMRHVPFFRWVATFGLILLGCSAVLDALVTVGFLFTAGGLFGGTVRASYRSSGTHRRPGRRAVLLRDAAALVDPRHRRAVRRAARLREVAALVARDHRKAVDAVRTAWAPSLRAQVDEELALMPVTRLRRVAGKSFPAGELAEHGVRTVRDVLDAHEWGLEHAGVPRHTAGPAVAAARRIAQERARAVTVRIEADRPEPHTTAVLAALRVLVEAGPRAKDAAERGAALAARLDALLADAAPAVRIRPLLTAGPDQLRRARAALEALHPLLDRAEREGLVERFAQASVDLLRGPDADPAGLDAWVDFESRPEKYQALLTKCADRTLTWAD
ncbi:hypothetical protein [Streptomyces vietnamensis]|uniref:hypothetical protein n=1 Tax=Streptomyces vietnamensis TaxID=362257 RepID=UPI0034380723